MRSESFSSTFRYAVWCSWFFANKFFFNFNIIWFFQCRAVTCQIAIGDFQQAFHFGKINPIVYDQNRHNAQSDATFKFFVKLIDVDHDMTYRRFPSNFKFSMNKWFLYFFSLIWKLVIGIFCTSQFHKQYAKHQNRSPKKPIPILKKRRKAIPK